MISIILHNIRSVHNVGSILRTSDARGVAKVYLCGYTPTPVDRFGKDRKDVAKVALGAEKTVSWEYRNDIHELIHNLQKDNTIVAIEQSSRSTPFNTYKPAENTVYIFGNEVEGIEDAVLDMSEHILEIPMLGKKESLNVSVSVGIILFSNLNR